MSLNEIIAATAQAVEVDPASAAVVFRASGVGGAGVLTTIRAGRHTLIVNEPQFVEAAYNDNACA